MALRKRKVKSKAKSQYAKGNSIKILLAIIALVSFILAFSFDSLNKLIVGIQPIANERCLQEFYKEVPPYLNKLSLSQQSYPLCFDGFNLMYSELSKTALWIAEVLTPHRLSLTTSDQSLALNSNRNMRHFIKPTNDGFYLWQLAPMGQNSNLSEDAYSSAAGTQIPFVSKAKLALFEQIEESIRAIVREHNVSVYMITGPAFLDRTLKITQDGIMVPTAIYKVIYIPKTGAIGAYYVPNDLSSSPRLVSICYLEERLGINLFPQLTEDEKRNTYKLPWKKMDIQADQPLEYLYWDAQSQCEEDISESKIETLQKQFKFMS
ncbi:DNA/RNA non-specific endonuclease [Acinetobacter equi]|uniref:ENPP1-3/EXOG-like endonuclease/phosphodiesterase domain-containing protein n=1 Tax=Acinetobacter equi TaxID=1324350 RepID=A0A0N9VCX9_9GAMM|nr:DNA/RNA non-specific endonuclease [Acinetobacter equi]ALH94951.1 hypothetical protein AOY20_05040 [Acinetobacter equi]